MDVDLLDPAAADLQTPETFPAQPEADLDLDDVGDDQVGQEVAITPDGGLVKKILVKGSGWEKPEKGDKVSVHYVGTLEDGTPFDSSRDRGDLFEFELGQGRVIKGWDLGVATMKKGEKSVLICKSDYAYGAQGSPPKIPPNATLHFEVELFSWTSLKDISGDGGVIKTITKEGEGWDTPRDRDEVVVHYTVHEAGSPEAFLTTPEAGETFSMATGHPLSRGLTRAVATMKRNEHAHLKLSPEYGFGAAATEAGVPANSEVEVHLNLARVLKVQNVTEDGGVVKKTLRADEDSYKLPNDGASVTIRYTGTLPDGSVFDARPEGNELTFTMEEGQVVEGLELAIGKMKKGELAKVDVAAQYGYGASGGKGSMADVPPNTPLVYEVELVDFVNTKETWELKEPEKIEAARARKDKGNAAFKAGKLSAAATAYEKAVGLINYDKDFSEDNKAAARDVKKSCWLNLAQVNLKQGDFKAATSNCNKVLELEPMNVKALYRVAQANIGTGDLLEAEMAIKRGLLAEEANSDLQALSKKLKVLAKAQNKKEASLYGKMFRPAPTPKNPPAAEATTAAVTGGPAPNGAAAHANGIAPDSVGPIEPGEEVTSGPTRQQPVTATAGAAASSPAAGAEPGLSEAAQIATAGDDGGIEAAGVGMDGLQGRGPLSEVAIAAASGEAMGDATGV